MKKALKYQGLSPLAIGGGGGSRTVEPGSDPSRMKPSVLHAVFQFWPNSESLLNFIVSYQMCTNVYQFRLSGTSESDKKLKKKKSNPVGPLPMKMRRNPPAISRLLILPQTTGCPVKSPRGSSKKPPADAGP